MNRTNPSIIRTGGDADLAFAVVVLASYFATFSSIQTTSTINIVIMIALGTAYLAIGIYNYKEWRHTCNYRFARIGKYEDGWNI